MLFGKHYYYIDFNNNNVTLRVIKSVSKKRVIK